MPDKRKKSLTDSPTSKFSTVEREEFYTRTEDAKRLYAEVINRYGTDFDFFIEPSCGMGAFLNLMPKNKIGIDIIFGTDFFTWEFPKGRNIVIGNPPFGRKGKLAMQFLNRCSEHCEVVAMILPSIFSKYTFINRVNPMMHLEYETTVSEFVTPKGDPYPVNSVFQIWENKFPQLRPKIVRRNSCDDFDMTHRHISRTPIEEFERFKKEYDFTISQIQGNIKDCKNVTAGSVFFVKDNTPDKSVRGVMERIDFSDLSKHHIGAISLTKADIVEGYLSVYYNKYTHEVL